MNRAATEKYQLRDGETLKRIKVDGITSLFNVSPIHAVECLRTLDEIIETLDDRGILELYEGGEEDIDKIISGMLRDVFDTLYTGNRDVDFMPRYTERLSENVEEVLRCNNLTYFITSVLPEFQMSWHHIEWGDLVHHHNKLCIEAARDHGKCLGREVRIRMYDGSTKRADELRVGELIMGIDSTPRRVTDLHIGRDENMYRIVQSRGDSFTVNSRHIQTCITIQNRRGNKMEDFELHIEDVEMPDLLKMTRNYRYNHIRTFKVGYEMEEKPVMLDPYLMGLFICCGNFDTMTLNFGCSEVERYLDEYTRGMQELCDHYRGRYNTKLNTYHTIYGSRRGKKQRNIRTSKIYSILNGYGLSNQNRIIPEVYLKNSRRVRLELLAGFLDTRTVLVHGSYIFRHNDMEVARQVKELARSLGFYVTTHNTHREDKKAIYITGNIQEIPVKKFEHKHKRASSKKSHKDWGTIDGVRVGCVSSIKFEPIGEGEYVSITTDGDKRFLLEDGTVTHNSYYFSNAYAIWQLYRYSPPKSQAFSRRPSSSNSNRGFLFSFSLQQAVDLIEILKGTIEGNDTLRERLMPTNSNEGAWASTNIMCKNGARLTGKGFGSSVRGAHPYWIIVDDGLKDNVIYSQLQRQKSIDYFHSVIMNMLVPGGQIVVVGTPFHAGDLYGDLKTKKGWFVIEYPAIFPDGRILWPQRWGFKDLLDKKNTQGNIIFSRENLCRPIVSDSSIFPLTILNRSLVRMENYTLVMNRDDFPMKFERVVTGADFAISSNVGGDFYCYTTFGIGEDGGMWLMDIQLGKGKSYNEQIQILKGLNVRFRPDVMVFESNIFQQIFSEEAAKYGMPVVPHSTGTEKNDLSKGWCALAIAFERGLIHIPIGDQKSRDAKDVIFEQLGSVAFTEKNGLASVSDHDDVCSSMWLAMLGRNISTTGFKFSFL